MVYSTSLLALKQRAKIKEGDEVLVLGRLAALGLQLLIWQKHMCALQLRFQQKKKRRFAEYADDVVVYGHKKG